MAEQLTRDILAILLEAGEENLPTLVNTLTRQGYWPDVEQGLADVTAALGALLRESLIELSRYDEGCWLPLTEQEQESALLLDGNLRWDASANMWTWNEEPATRLRPVVVLTPTGQRRIRTLLASDPGTVDNG